MTNLIFNEDSRQPYKIIDIMIMPEPSIWGWFVEYMFWTVILSFVLFVEKFFILNLSLKQKYYWKTLSMSFMVQWTVIFLLKQLLTVSANIWLSLKQSAKIWLGLMQLIWFYDVLNNFSFPLDHLLSLLKIFKRVENEANNSITILY